jgi:hypothetical protein
MRFDAPLKHRVSKPLIGLAFASVAVWAMILPATQREQRLRHVIEQDLRAGRYADALAEMSRHQQPDFPPHWEPPPRPGFPDFEIEQLLATMEAIERQSPAQWVRDIYIDRFARSVMYGYQWRDPQKVDPARLRRLVERFYPERPLGTSRSEVLEWLDREAIPTTASSTRRSN